MLLLDTAAEATRLYSSVNYPFVPSVLGELSDFWGIRFYGEYVVADLDNSITVDATSNYQNNPAYTQDIIQFKMKKENFNPSHMITKNLNSLLLSSASVILPIEGANVDFIPLLQASKISSVMSNKVVYDGLNPRQILTYFKADNNSKILAAAVRGKNPDNQFNMVVIGDTDFIHNDFWARSQILMDKTLLIPLFDNPDFILNSLDYLTDNTDLLNLRGKSALNREFTDVERLRKLNLFEYKIKEEEIFKQIDNVKKQLQEIWNKKDFEERQNFTADELAIISSVRKKLDGLRKDLSNIRLQAGKDIERIGMKIKFINIFAIPLLLSFILFILLISKNRKKIKTKADFKLNRQLLRLIVFSFFVLLIGIISVYISNRSDIQKYEDKPVFANLKDKINDVDEISIKTYKNELNFIKDENGIWTMKNGKKIPVYQERIRSFLSALLEAKFYEKKSDKAQNLRVFGLQPIETEDSPNTRIVLSDANGNKIQAFEVGKYDVSLGRGSKAAYLKFDGQFQVWLAEVDFVDLSSKEQDWTYSTAWNLRFGRLEEVNNMKDVETLANIMKVILNMPFIGETTNIDGAKNVYTLKMHVENYNEVKIDFYQKGDKVWLKYEFAEPITNNHLQFFAKYVNGSFLEISKESLELIKYAAEHK